MMKLDYGELISPTPIALSIGRIKKPTLKDISRVGFRVFYFYESLLLLTPRLYFEELQEKDFWDSLSEDKKNEIGLYDVIKSDESLQSLFTKVLGFFLIEKVTFNEGEFCIEDGEKNSTISLNDTMFYDLLNIIRQVCNIDDKDATDENLKFKNEATRKLFEKMKRAKKEKKSKKVDINFTLPNLISAVANKHPSLNYSNIWELTLFQFFDTFARLQNNLIFDIDTKRVSVWGDEGGKYDISLWYKNEFDKK